jgi:SPP1 gp7 family putative phage head morphogenesis protein
MNNSPFKRPSRLEAIYRNEIDRLISKYFSLPTNATLGEISSRLVEWKNAESFLKQLPMQLAQKMITMQLATNARNWRETATKSSQGKYIYQVLNQKILQGKLGQQVNTLIQENAQLIKTVPLNLSLSLTKHIQEQFIKGVRAEEIVKQIRPKLNNLKAYQINRIARTEVAKADTAITRVRAQAIGLNWYQWQTSEDARVRQSHKKMDLVLVNWNDAPSPEQLIGEQSEGHYHAGNIYNCRCVALPILSLDEIHWPCKVFYSNSIHLLTRKQFVLKSGLPLRLAA